MNPLAKLALMVITPIVVALFVFYYLIHHPATLKEGIIMEHNLKERLHHAHEDPYGKMRDYYVHGKAHALEQKDHALAYAHEQEDHALAYAHEKKDHALAYAHEKEDHLHQQKDHLHQHLAHVDHHNLVWWFKTILVGILVAAIGVLIFLLKKIEAHHQAHHPDEHHHTTHASPSGRDHAANEAHKDGTKPIKASKTLLDRARLSSEEIDQMQKENNLRVVSSGTTTPDGHRKRFSSNTIFGGAKKSGADNHPAGTKMSLEGLQQATDLGKAHKTSGKP